MIDDAKRHPPSQRKLARLWRDGSTPASPALVGLAVIAVSAFATVLAGPAALGWMSAWIREALQATAQPDGAQRAARSIALQGGLLVAVIGVTALAAALAAQAAQMGARGDAAPAAPARWATFAAPKIDGWRVARAGLFTAVAGVTVAAAVRGVLSGVGDTSVLPHPEMMMALARSVAWPLLIVLTAAAVVDATVGRAIWLRQARMTRREVEEEMREAQGPSLTRERCGVTARRRKNA